MKITPALGNELKFVAMFFCNAVNISMETINQKNGKSMKLEFCEKQMSYEKANISALSYGV